MIEWDTAWDKWRNTINEVGDEAKTKLTASESGAILGFASQVAGVLRELQELEKKIEKGAPNPPAFRDVFKSILNKLHTQALSSSAVVGGVAVNLVNRIWSSAIEAFTTFLEREGAALQVEGWSLGATVGFPSGISSTLTVNFRSSTFKK